MNRQEELEGMSNFEINKLVALLSGKKHRLANGIFWGISPFAPPMTVYNWCKNPEDIMPLAIENRISLCASEFDNDEYVAFSQIIRDSRGFGAHYHKVASINPYQAICIVLILMKETENETK